jgi:hypothetical protein
LAIDSLKQVPLKKNEDARLITNTSGKIVNLRHSFADTTLAGYRLPGIFLTYARNPVS